VAGKRLRGSVHNRHFYDILDELHASGAARAVRSQVREAALDHGLSIPAEQFEIASPADMLADWQVGDTVGFGAGAQHRHGLIKRINRKTCTVDGSGRWQGLRYRVPAQLLHRLPDGLAEQ
jgi:hypothetical protein